MDLKILFRKAGRPGAAARKAGFSWTRSLFFLAILAYTAGCSPAAAVSDPATAVPAAALVPTPAPTLTLTALPLPQPSPTPAGCQETNGRVVQQEIQSGHLPKAWPVRVYLPPCYNPRPASPYPVLLLLHGQGSGADQWERVGITQAADRKITKGELAPLLIVMPYEEQSLVNPYESGYDAAVVEDLLPWLEQTYPACRQRGCRAIGGISRGAAWAMLIGLNHWDLFGAIGAHSLPPFYGDYNRLPYLVRVIPKDQMPQIWMDSGKRDRYLSEARHYHALLNQYKVTHEWTEFEGEHNEAYWTAQVETYLRWYGQFFPR